MTFLIVHGYSAESKTDTDDAIRNIYGELPGLLRDRFGANVEELDLSRYISLEDGITIDDISRAMDRTLHRDFQHLLDSGCNVIVHSTGALVVRNWLRRYWDPGTKCPIHRVIHLAGANFGSGWAHIGRTQLAKWIRLIWNHSERGLSVLTALELGSNWTIDMHRDLQAKILSAKPENQPLEFCLIGSQRPDEYSPAPIKYATEEASDGVVRVPGGNVNYSYLKIVPKEHVKEMAGEEVESLADKGLAVTPRTVRNPNLSPTDEVGSDYYFVGEGWESRIAPFTVVFDCSHTYRSSSIVDGERPREQVLSLIENAVNTDITTLDQSVAFFQDSYASTLARARQMDDGRYALIYRIARRPQYNQYCQIVFRVYDQDNTPVKSFNVYFNSFGGGEKPSQSINDLFKDGHPNGISSNTITFFVQRKVWKQTGKSVKEGDWMDVLDDVKGIDLEIDALDHGNDLVAYLPLRYRLNRETLQEWLQPNQTTIVDVHLYRMPKDQVFKIVNDR